MTKSVKHKIREGLFSTPTNTVFDTIEGVVIHTPTVKLWNKIAREAQTAEGEMDNAEFQWLILLNLSHVDEDPNSECVFELSDREAFFDLPTNHPIAKISRRALEAFSGNDIAAAKNASPTTEATEVSSSSEST